MKALFASVVAVVTAVGCTPIVSQHSSPQSREVAYTCTDGQNVSVRFFPEQGVATLLRHGETIELQQKPTGSGFLYSNGPSSIRGKGDDLTLEIGRMASLQCTAR